MSKPVVLLILDGWGLSEESDHNAITQGETPLFDAVNKTAPPVALHASGEEVGLPPGQMGNSEVGHLNIGAGRVVLQDLMRINAAIKDESIYTNRALVAPFERARKRGAAVHLMGLVSDGGVHSDMAHIGALLEIGKQQGIGKLFVHALMDGRDTPPDSGADYLQALEAMIDAAGVGAIASVTGRFHTMDRDKRWDRVERGYNACLFGEGGRFRNAIEAITDSYKRDILDEFVEPSLIVDADGVPIGAMQEGDELIMFNFRSDRMREIVRAFAEPEFGEFNRRDAPLLSVTTMTLYHPDFTYPVAFDVSIPENGLGAVLAQNGLKQFRSAETEKYAHVTFFFNGGREREFEGEVRKLVPSPKVRTYDMQPEMSCSLVTDGVVAAIESEDFPVIIVNLANGDMVGHTGVWEAALEAVAAVDHAVGRIKNACDKTGARLLITADHGNIEKMRENGKPMTAHTTNPVPFYYVGPKVGSLRSAGRLADIAPTILHLLEIEQPAEMTGRSLLER